MEQIDQLSVALIKAQSEMKGAKKETENKFFKSKYADLGSVWEACHKALTDNGLSIAQRGTYREGNFFLTTTLIHKSGQIMSGEYLIKPVKDDPQAYGSAWTYARRYSLAAMVGVISEDDDANAASDPSGVKTVTRESVTNTSGRTTEDSGFEVAKFIPSRVVYVEGKGKGAGKTFSEIYRQDGAKFSGTETAGQIAESAMTSKKEIIVAFEKKGNFLNIKSNGVKMADSQPDPEPVIEEVPF